MRGDFVQFDGKLVKCGEKFTDIDDKILVMKNQLNNKVVYIDSNLDVLQDYVAEINDDILWTRPFSSLHVVREVTVRFMVIFPEVWF